jgi:hypothetical protein
MKEMEKNPLWDNCVKKFFFLSFEKKKFFFEKMRSWEEQRNDIIHKDQNNIKMRVILISHFTSSHFALSHFTLSHFTLSHFSSSHFTSSHFA